MSLDNTFDGETIVCDPCYIAIQPFTKSGQALTDEIPEAIGAYYSNRSFIEGTDDVDGALAKAEGWRDKSTPGYPAHRSASALVAMAKAEQRRREAGYDIVSVAEVNAQVSRHNDPRDREHDRLVAELRSEIRAIVEQPKYEPINAEAWGCEAAA